jgi:prepilin-type N-terminal cleavage/methylation domain-containing protein
MAAADDNVEGDAGQRERDAGGGQPCENDRWHRRCDSLPAELLRPLKERGFKIVRVGDRSARNSHHQEVRTMLRNTKGFTLIELMIVVVIIGILAAIAIPNFISMQDRAREGSVKSNMHTFQLAVEDFAVQNDGTYPVAADAATVEALLPGGAAPTNPFIGGATNIVWAGAAGAQGELGYAIPALNQYTITGFGESALLTLTLENF